MQAAAGLGAHGGPEDRLLLPPYRRLKVQQHSGGCWPARDGGRALPPTRYGATCRGEAGKIALYYYSAGRVGRCVRRRSTEWVETQRRCAKRMKDGVPVELQRSAHYARQFLIRCDLYVPV